MNKSVILDPTGIYPISPDYIPITTEVEWMRSFLITEGQYWVKGKFLCAWTQEWLRTWNKVEMIQEIKQDPRIKLTKIFSPVPIPQIWTAQQILILVTQLESYPQNDPIAHLLADVTESRLQFWLDAPSIDHLAQWLNLKVPENYQLLEQVWQNRFKNHQLTSYYQTEDKLQLLRQWIGIAQPTLSLDPYPLPIPNCLSQEFDDYWQQQIYKSDGKVIDQLIPTAQIGIKRIANIAYNILINRPQWINKIREKKITPYLKHQQKTELQSCLPFPQPEPLNLDATPEETLTWTTQKYLPFRRWEINYQSNSTEQKISDHLAIGFVEWTIKSYPELKIIPVSDSLLNYNVAYIVQNLCQESPVFWVVVDGLGWLDHQELISYLIKDYKLAIETELKPRFSILPTKTQYAKWSLYTQLTPLASHWSEDIKKGFQKMGIGKRYTDKQVNNLYEDLREQKQQLYCWDTTLFDEVQHEQKDWESFAQLERPQTLKRIAEKINYCLQQYPNSENLRIVIASDHGQIMGVSSYLSPCPVGIEPKGRMAIGKTDDPRFVMLERDRYDLPYDISIIKNSDSFNSFCYTKEKQIIGSHGGLFPEEVVIGFSVLRTSVQRTPVLLFCQGTGKARELGNLEITIDNPNSVSLTNLCLYIQELPDLKMGKFLEKEIPSNQRILINFDISICPEIPRTHQENTYQLPLTGKLTFEYANSEIGKVPLDTQSSLTIQQMFSSGLDIDEFL